MDLSKKEYKTMDLSENLFEKFIGGSGLAAWLFFKLSGFKSESYDPENPLIFMTGPLTGTMTPSSGRHAVISRSPLSGFLGESTTGGFWGSYLKRAGYDGVIVVGRAEEPVYIYIDEENVEIDDAGDLWGLNFYETKRELEKRYGKRVKVSAIGRAGEKLVRFASIMNDHGRAAGRMGMGAVMGSKNLKAIVVYGEKQINVANEEFHDYIRGKLDEMRDAAGVQFFKQFGTAFYVDYGYSLGDVPAKYYSEGEFPAEQISGMTLSEMFHVIGVPCYACMISCGRLVKLEDGRKIDGPEYETIIMLGAQNMVFNLKSIVEANHLCNDYGLDTISTGAVISFAHKLYEEGVLKEKDVGFELRWGDEENLIELVKLIGEREGIGDLLAEGSYRVAKKLGYDLEMVAVVKGVEIPAHDPRASYGQALSYATGNNGADHNRADYYLVDVGGFEDPDLGLKQTDRFTLEDKVVQVIKMQNLREVYNSLSICIFPNLTIRELSEMLNLATGWKTTPSSLDNVGARIFNLKRSLNVMMGVSRQHDKLPRIVLEPYKNGNIAGLTPKDQLPKALDEYYKMRGWDLETGKPTPETLKSLELTEVINKL